MSYSQTYENLCVLLEEYEGSTFEELATQILAMLGIMGEDNLDALNPPPGLRHWLLSHGLALVVVQEGRSPKVWEATQEDEEDEDDTDPEDDVSDIAPQVGDFVDYQTIPRGPSNSSQIGSGRVHEIGSVDGREIIWVRVPGGGEVYLVPGEGDMIKVRPTGDEP